MDKQKCPICEREQEYSQRYPIYICQYCLKDGVKVDGNVVRVADLNVYMKGRVACTVKGFNCMAQEAYFGGTVVNLIAEPE